MFKFRLPEKEANKITKLTEDWMIATQDDIRSDKSNLAPSLMMAF